MRSCDTLYPERQLKKHNEKNNQSERKKSKKMKIRASSSKPLFVRFFAIKIIVPFSFYELRTPC